MSYWREKVADKLSRILADSPSSPSHVARDSPVVRPEPQGLPMPTEELNRLESHSFSSLISSFISIGRNDYKPNPSRHLSDTSRSSIHLVPKKWRNRKHSWKERPPEEIPESARECETYEVPEICDEDLEPESERDSTESDKFEEALGSPSLSKCIPDLADESSFISPDLYEFLQSCLPNIVKGCQWVLLYSTARHGISLRTLLRRSATLPGPCLLIVGDGDGAVFGGLLESPLQATAKRKYQGTNQTFVFTTIYGAPRLFRATGVNRYYYLCLNDMLAFGGGGNFALCLDGDLLRGTSGPCDTFGNLCLAHSPEFDLRNVELWGFAHTSRYLA
ncbi:hypothetical protein H6P81_011875 [Aristolochia fimbriata]|uniref:TLDc domain-containing protein n=1 Tax=Aristolochia fimbriata TaxID=158543 RepID=A0AAV7EA67_ARIFI|nr:hypothetical protein H6P81_011875 [Aristolochia fimbriata]